MDRHITESRVLARIPDLNAFGSDIPEEPGGRGGSLEALGARLINQSLSIKLLSGLALVLFVVSVAPFFFGGKKSDNDATAALEPAEVWHADSRGTEPESPIVAGGSAPPMTVVSATPEQESPPEILPAESPMMSSWPAASQSAAPEAEGEMTPWRIGARPMAVRPPEYQADARSGASGSPGTNTQYHNPNDNPAAGNRYDSTRPSIY